MGPLDTPAAEEVLVHTAQRLATAGHGKKGAIARATAAQLGVSVQALYGALRKRRYGTRQVSADGKVRRRKRRRDACQSILSLDEARAIAAYIQTSERNTGKVLASIQAALDTLRANGEVLAGRVDTDTGEFHPLSVSAVARALRTYHCHPAQLRQAAPKVALASPHPNYCWQIDPSLCVLYYLRGEKGLRAMPHDEFYKNKPANLARVAQERVWRYVFVDHTTGAFYVEYVLGAESGPNLCSTFINAMQQRGPEDPFCGVPHMAMLDPGSANTGAMFKSLAAALGVALQINLPKQPWVKGSVEKHNDLIEREFEHRLRFHRVESLAQLNEAAWRWMRGYQATVAHSRTGMTRYAAWMRITAEQLRLAPPPERCRELANHAPETRVVSEMLRVSFKGRRYDVSRVPGVMVGAKVLVARNAWADDSVHVLGHDEHGTETHYVAERVERDQWGFEGAAMLGSELRRAPTTVADTERAAVERVAMDANTDEEAAAKRKAGALPFGGRIDPYKPITDTPEPHYLPRRGHAVQADAPAVVTPPPAAREPARNPAWAPQPLSHVQMAKALKARIESRGGAWTGELYARMAERWPGGVLEQDLDGCAAQLLQGGLRVVGGEA